MAPAWKIVEDVSGGTQTMRANKYRYLPKETGEQPQDYQRRLSWSVFFNAYAKTRDALVGLVFKSNPVFTDIPPTIENDLENIDLMGNHVDVFAKELFNDAFEGHAFILVDMQPQLPTGSTLADERAAGRRPFWVRYKANQALNWRTQVIDGETVLQQITFQEITNEPDGQYGEKQISRYRVFRLVNGAVQWELWEKTKGPDGQETVTPASIEPNSGTLSVSRIPVAVVYGNRTGYMESTPPLLDLAYLNIDHYQQVSDYRTQLHYLLPILVRVGVPESDRGKLEVGPLSVADLPNKETCDLKYISHDGKAIDATSKAIGETETRMAVSGISMLSARDRTTNITATEIRATNLQQTSDLATMARSLEDALELALDFHGEYLGLPDAGTVKMGTAQADIVLDGPTIAALAQLVPGLLSPETFLNLLETGLGGFDAEEEVAKLKAALITTNQPPNPQQDIQNGGVQ